ncbi:MAG TPA: transglutaminase family protein [Stellaceae bacterium]|nr:transglutaminase family protein [Stellaceae bacterium]
MRLQVRHQTAYHYASLIHYAIQTLRLTPQPHDGLGVLRWRVRGEGRRALPSFVDGFGNLAHTHTVNHPHSSAAVFVEGEVETQPTDGVVRGAAEPLPPIFFLRPTALTSPDAALADFAASITGASELDRLYGLMNAVRDRIDYRPGVTHAATPAAAALVASAGVCQDHAHVFIAAARLLGIPARYVGGYLWTGDDIHEYEASHAWAEAYVEHLGWVGFDAANRVCPGEAYIRTAIGLDYWSAAPVRGLRRGEASERLAVKVSVMQAGAEQ